MPVLNLSELNIVTSLAGAFLVLYGVFSVKIKNAWYLGEALPAMLIGICFGPVAANFLNSKNWGLKEEGQQSEITLGITRVVICLQLVIAGYQLPAKYVWQRRRDIFMCLIPIMALMWLCTAGCFMATIPNITFLAGLAIAASVTCTDPVLSQAVAKGPFADRYVARPLREIISAEACLNDGFGFPFLMLAVYLIRHADPIPYDGEGIIGDVHKLMVRAGDDVGRLGGGPGVAIKNWVLETWLYYVIMSAMYGIIVGFAACKGIKFSLRRRWIDSESYVLFPVAIGLFTLGTCGCLGTNDLLACTVAGVCLNWDGEFLAETERRHDEVNSCFDVLLNFGGFMYIGSVIPWASFHDPDGTGITIWRLLLLGLMVLALRRIPAVLLLYRLMPSVIANYKEALFMGYFGPIGIGAVFYVEHIRHVVPAAGEGDPEQDDLIRALPITIYFLVVFSIVVHGLSIPLLSVLYGRMGIKPIQEDAVTIRRKSLCMAPPTNAVTGDDQTFIAYNRFRRPTIDMARDQLPFHEDEDTEGRDSCQNAVVKPPNYPEEDDEAEKKRYQRRVVRYGV
uniref:Cation/H+ exchanger transmembrane domain-containing protein n=1 Tax=Bionectria ochroleuca TaxID=29856 RepID=A0A8H7TTH4_BIOOC